MLSCSNGRNFAVKSKSRREKAFSRLACSRPTLHRWRWLHYVKWCARPRVWNGIVYNIVCNIVWRQMAHDWLWLSGPTCDAHYRLAFNLITNVGMRLFVFERSISSCCRAARPNWTGRIAKVNSVSEPCAPQMEQTCGCAESAVPASAGSVLTAFALVIDVYLHWLSLSCLG